MFESLPTDVAYQMFVQTLKLRAKIDIVEYSKIVDFIKSIEHNDEQEYDGIEYNSTTNPGGYNLAIFNPDLFECVSVSVYDIEKLQYTSKRVL